jgi:hypothetical protein
VHLPSERDSPPPSPSYGRGNIISLYTVAARCEDVPAKRWDRGFYSSSRHSHYSSVYGEGPWEIISTPSGPDGNLDILYYTWLLFFFSARCKAGLNLITKSPGRQEATSHTSYLGSGVCLIYSSIFMIHSFVFSLPGSHFGRDDRIHTTLIF